MSWATALCALYDRNAYRAGEVENWNGKPLVLMPIGFDTMKAQIEIMINMNGDFITARVLDKSESATIVPYPDRRTSDVKALPLCDSLAYIAGDFMGSVVLLLNDMPDKKKSRTLSDIKKSFPSYLDGISKWSHSAYSHPMVIAVYDYISKKKVIADLLKSGVLVPDDDLRLTDKRKIQGIRIDKAFVRFRVYSKDIQETATWLNKDVQKSFVHYYMSTSKNADLCYFTGEHELIARTNPVKIRGEWDTKASLISSNDESNFTYRGRFLAKDKGSGYNEAMSIGYETSQKIHNALKWIIRRQGYTRDGVCIVAWEIDLRAMPQYYRGANEILSESTDEDAQTESDILFDEPEDENAETNYASAKDFNLAIDGYAKDLSNASQMIVLALDSASPGRLAMTYYKELETSTYLANIRAWQESCCWRQEYFNKKRNFRRYEGMASIQEIATAVYGTEKDKQLHLLSNSDGKCPMLISAFDRLRPCIIDGAVIPRDMVKMAVQKASNPVAYEKQFNYQRVLHVACSLVKKYYWDKGVRYDMELDETCTNRSYLYGRLLAVAEKIERSTYDKGETRTTNAERYMQQFSRTPMRTWEIIRRNTQVYLNQLRPSSREFYKNLYGEIDGLFIDGAYEEKCALDGRFLLGYDCQRKALKYRKNDNINVDSTNDDGETRNTEEEE